MRFSGSRLDRDEPGIQPISFERCIRSLFRIADPLIDAVGVRSGCCCGDRDEIVRGIVSGRGNSGDRCRASEVIFERPVRGGIIGKGPGPFDGLAGIDDLGFDCGYVGHSLLPLSRKATEDNFLF